MTTLYVKQCKRYKPLKEYDPMVLDALSEGVYLVVVKPGSTSLKFVYQPDYFHMLSAFEASRVAMEKVMIEKSKFKPNKKLTKKEKAVWDELKDKLDINILVSSSIQEVVEAGYQVLLEQVNLLNNKLCK